MFYSFTLQYNTMFVYSCNDKYTLRMAEYRYQIMSITIFVQHSYKKLIGVKSTSFSDQFIV